MKSELVKFDESLSEQVDKIIVGVDEVGRGAWAGPIFAAAAYIPEEAREHLWDVNDSKKFEEWQREELFKKIKKLKVQFAIGWATTQEVDKLNVLNATFKAMRDAIERLRRALGVPKERMLILVDGNVKIRDLEGYEQITIVKGDATSLTIATASIVAKVLRDRTMRQLAKRHPGYQFELHKGYVTPIHKRMVQKLGLTELHRKSFKIS